MAPWLGEPIVDEYKGLRLKSLPLNYAYVIANTSLQNAGVYTVSDDCYDCPFELMQALSPDKEVSWQVDISVQQTWRIMKNNQQKYLARSYRRGLLCESRQTLGEFGVYRLEIGLCGLREEVAPLNSYFPLMLCCAVFLSFFLLYISTKCIRHCRRKVEEIRNGKQLQKKTQEKSYKHGMESLYVMRGLLVSLLIFIIGGGGGYPLFNNVRGELTLADWIYYIYAWTVGLLLPTTIEQEKAEGLSKRNSFICIVKRALILIFVGSLIDSMAYIPGSSLGSKMVWWLVQRLGIAYFLVAIFYLMTAKNFEFRSKKVITKLISTVVTLKWCCVLAGALYAVMVIMIPISLSLNCFGNSELDDHLAEFSNNSTEVTLGCRSEMITVFNDVLVGRSSGIFSMDGYYGFSAGLMGILTTIVVMLTGLTAGTSYLTEDSHRMRLKLWSIWATLLGVCGLIIAGISFPLQLNLWPIATIFGVSSLAFCLYMIIYSFTEKKQSRNPVLTSTGIASLIILSGYLLLSNSIPFHWGKKFTNHLFYLLQNIGFVFLWIIIAIILRKRDIRFSI